MTYDAAADVPSPGQLLHILIADNDARLTMLLRSSLEGDGHDVLVSQGVSGLRVALDSRPPALVLIDVEHERSEGVAVVSAWRDGAAGARASVVVTGGWPDDHPQVSKALRDVKADRYLRKPFSFLDLGDLVRTISPPSAPAAPRRRQPAADDGVAALTALASRSADRDASPRDGAPPPLFHARRQPLAGLRKIARLWATRVSGRLVVTFPSGEDQVCRLSDGGPIDGASWPVLEAAIAGGLTRFELGAMPPGGDTHGLAAFLLQHARKVAQPDFVDRHRFEAPSAPRWRDVAERVALGADTRALLAQADGRTPLGTLVAKAGPGAQRAVADLAALVALGLFDMQPPVAGGASGAAQLPRRVRMRPVGDEQVDPPTVERPTRRSPDFGSALATQKMNRRQGGASARAFETAPTGSFDQATLPRASSRRSEQSTGSFQQNRSQPTSTSGPRPGRGRGRSSTDHSISNLRSDVRGGAHGGPQALHRRLKGELSRLETAAPAVVLGIPQDSELELVEQAAERLTARYSGIADQPRMPGPVRDVARRLGQLVSGAHRSMVHNVRTKNENTVVFDDFADRPTEAGSGLAAEAAKYLKMGRTLMERQDWVRADKALTRARDLELANPVVLAALGWSRFKNPDRTPADQIEEGRDLLVLSEQFGGVEDAQTQLWLAQVFEASKELQKAELRARRAARLDPEEPAAAALVLRLQKALAAAPPAD
jgi:CheY-like chemotaxis protein